MKPRFHYIFKNNKGGANVTMHIKGDNVPIWETLIKFYRVRYPTLAWAAFMTQIVRTYIENLDPQDQELYLNIAAKHSEENFGKSEVLLSTIREVMDEQKTKPPRSG